MTQVLIDEFPSVKTESPISADMTIGTLPMSFHLPIAIAVLTGYEDIVVKLSMSGGYHYYNYIMTKVSSQLMITYTRMEL